MITNLDITDLYNWAKNTEFPVKTAPTIEGYSNKSIDYYWIKSVKKSTLIREKLMTDKVCKIYDNDDILFSNYAIFYAGTILKPHKDPNILRYPYKRIQIPLTIPNKNECYMQWVDVKDGKVTWEEGVPQVCDVMNHLHEAFNKSDKPMEILFVDVKHDTEVVINR
jgi:aspartyl/asparaginyl beta-hydroxylase (cupin superfamily)